MYQYHSINDSIYEIIFNLQVVFHNECGDL